MIPMIREKTFHTPCQEEVYRQVGGFLDDLVDQHFDDAEHCDFYLKFGTTLVEISINPYEQDDAVVEILAYVVHGVTPSLELMRELLSVNAQVPMGAFSVVHNDVYFSHAFLGRRLDPDQFLASLSHVAMVADEYDDQIVGQFGGERALDRLRSISQRKAEAQAHSN